MPRASLHPPSLPPSPLEHHGEDEEQADGSQVHNEVSEAEVGGPLEHQEEAHLQEEEGQEGDMLDRRGGRGEEDDLRTTHPPDGRGPIHPQGLPLRQEGRAWLWDCI